MGVLSFLGRWLGADREPSPADPDSLWAAKVAPAPRAEALPKTPAAGQVVETTAMHTGVGHQWYGFEGPFADLPWETKFIPAFRTLARHKGARLRGVLSATADGSLRVEQVEDVSEVAAGYAVTIRDAECVRRGVGRATVRGRWGDTSVGLVQLGSGSLAPIQLAIEVEIDAGSEALAALEPRGGVNVISTTPMRRGRDHVYRCQARVTDVLAPVAPYSLGDAVEMTCDYHGQDEELRGCWVARWSGAEGEAMDLWWQDTNIEGLYDDGGGRIRLRGIVSRDRSVGLFVGKVAYVGPA